MPCILDNEAFLYKLKQIVFEVVQEAFTAHSRSKPPTYAPDQLLTEKQVSQLMTCSVRTLQTWRKRPGKGPRPTMVGTLARYRYANVLKFIDESEV